MSWLVPGDLIALNAWTYLWTGELDTNINAHGWATSRSAIVLSFHTKLEGTHKNEFVLVLTESQETIGIFWIDVKSVSGKITSHEDHHDDEATVTG